MDTHALDAHGIRNIKRIWWDQKPAALYEHPLRRGESALAKLGPLVVNTGRSPNDRFVVREIDLDDGKHMENPRASYRRDEGYCIRRQQCWN